MKHLKKTAVLGFLFLLSVFAGCGNKEAESFEGILSPDRGEVIATIDGEDFHYAREYLLFRDLAPYPEDPGEALPS